MPPQVPLTLQLIFLTGKLGSWTLFAFRSIAVITIWLAFVPWANINFFRAVFWMSDALIWAGGGGTASWSNISVLNGPPLPLGASSSSQASPSPLPLRDHLLRSIADANSSAATLTGRYKTTPQPATNLLRLFFSLLAMLKPSNVLHIVFQLVGSPIDAMESLWEAHETFIRQVDWKTPLAEIGHDIFLGQVLTCVLVIGVISAWFTREWVLMHLPAHVPEDLRDERDAPVPAEPGDRQEALQQILAQLPRQIEDAEAGTGLHEEQSPTRPGQGIDRAETLHRGLPEMRQPQEDAAEGRDLQGQPSSSSSRGLHSQADMLDSTKHEPSPTTAQYEALRPAGGDSYDGIDSEEVRAARLARFSRTSTGAFGLAENNAESATLSSPLSLEALQAQKDGDASSAAVDRSTSDANSGAPSRAATALTTDNAVTETAGSATADTEDDWSSDESTGVMPSLARAPDTAESGNVAGDAGTLAEPEPPAARLLAGPDDGEVRQAVAEALRQARAEGAADQMALADGGHDVGDEEANWEDVEGEMEGLFAAIGFHGHPVHLLANVSIVIAFCSLFIIFCLGLPYLIGRLFGLGAGLVEVMMAPIRLVRLISDPLFDWAIDATSKILARTGIIRLFNQTFGKLVMTSDSSAGAPQALALQAVSLIAEVLEADLDASTAPATSRPFNSASLAFISQVHRLPMTLDEVVVRPLELKLMRASSTSDQVTCVLAGLIWILAGVATENVVTRVMRPAKSQENENAEPTDWFKEATTQLMIVVKVLVFLAIVSP